MDVRVREQEGQDLDTSILPRLNQARYLIADEAGAAVRVSERKGLA
jgi:hypothetical protein